MIFNDLRDFIDEVERMGELKKIEGADWNLEIGGITEIVALSDNPVALLFDKIKGYPAGYRVATNLFANQRRQALALGLPIEAKGIELVDAWRKKVREVEPIPPVWVDDGPVKENIYVGDEVNVLKFPSPKWHELDGGRYIGTGCVVITRDPDEGWVNLGVYRAQVYDKETIGFHAIPGRHAEVMRQKYWARGLSCPVAIALGQEPLLYAAACNPVPWGVSEYDYAGGLKGEPIKVVRGVYTDLPIPATAEIVLEGESPPPSVESRPEGPFGEWSGYYAGLPHPKPVIKVKAILHRDNPILQGNPPLKPPAQGHSLGSSLTTAAFIWNSLESHIPNVKGVWIPPEVSPSRALVTVVSIKQSYPGHAKQAGLLAMGCLAGYSYNRYVIVVDDDIDPSNLGEVAWAVATRSDPSTDIQVITEGLSGPADPLIHPERKEKGYYRDLTTSKAIINACKPYSWMDKFPPTNRVSPELAKKIIEKWGRILGIKP
jgi:4-hydroxy-3-polyprenylbenzoate decarboxylase